MNIPDDTRAALAAACKANNLDPAPIETLALPAVRLVATPADDADIPVGATKLGADPDLPAGFPWPMVDDRPMAFMAQINLAEAHACAPINSLPREGTLVVFYDALAQPWGIYPTDRAHWQAAIIPADAPRTRTRMPTFDAAARDDLYGVERLLACRVDMQPVVSWPDAESLEVQDLGIDWHAYAKAIESVSCEIAHLLGGHANTIQGEMRQSVAELEAPGEIVLDRMTNPFTGQEVEISRKIARPGDPPPDPRAWTHILTINSDDGLGVTWGDCGALYLWAHADSLASAKLDRTWIVLQCY